MYCPTICKIDEIKWLYPHLRLCKKKKKNLQKKEKKKERKKEVKASARR